MAGAIYCGFARVAVHVHSQKHTSRNNQLLPRWKENVIGDYNRPIPRKLRYARYSAHPLN